jgi:hypothetical protein
MYLASNARETCGLERPGKHCVSLRCKTFEASCDIGAIHCRTTSMGRPTSLPHSTSDPPRNTLGSATYGVSSHYPSSVDDEAINELLNRATKDMYSCGSKAFLPASRVVSEILELPSNDRTVLATSVASIFGDGASGGNRSSIWERPRSTFAVSACHGGLSRKHPKNAVIRRMPNLN